MTFSLKVTDIIKQPLAEGCWNWNSLGLTHGCSNLVPGHSQPGGESRLPLITNSGKSLPRACLRTCCQCFPLSLIVCMLGQRSLQAGTWTGWKESCRDQILPSTPGAGQRPKKKKRWLQHSLKLSLWSCWNPWNLVSFLFQISGGAPPRTAIKGHNVTVRWASLMFYVSFGLHHLQYHKVHSKFGFANAFYM